METIDLEARNVQVSPISGARVNVSIDIESYDDLLDVIPEKYIEN